MPVFGGIQGDEYRRIYGSSRTLFDQCLIELKENSQWIFDRSKKGEEKFRELIEKRVEFETKNETERTKNFQIFSFGRENRIDSDEIIRSIV